MDTLTFGTIARNPTNGLTIMWVAEDYEKMTLSWAMAIVLVAPPSFGLVAHRVGDVHPFVWTWEGWEWL